MTRKVKMSVNDGPEVEIDLDNPDDAAATIAAARADAEHPDDETADEALGDDIALATIDLAIDTLSGDLRDAVLDLFKNRQKPWQEMGEQDKRATVDHIDHVTERLVGRACMILAAGGRLTAPATLDVFKQKGRDLDASLKLIALPDTVAALSRACGSTVQIVFVDAEPFKGERAPVEIEPDQGSIFDKTEQGADHAAEVE